MHNACCIVLCLLCAFRHAVLFGFFGMHWLGHVAFLFGICILHALVMHCWAYIMHAQGMQNALLCLLAFCMYVVLHALVIHFRASYFMHAQGMQHACFCLLAFCMYIVSHALVMPFWAYFMHGHGMQNAFLCLVASANTSHAKGMRHACCIVLLCACSSVSIVLQKACNMRAALFFAACVEFVVRFCLDLLAYIG